MTGELASLDHTTGWLNSPPLTAAGLRGRVVLTSFWTYTCINWLRTLPYLRAWHDRYAGDGLVVLGVHTPEFAFEHDLGNVRRAVAANRIDYPVVTDNDFGVWNAFGNRYWPALYLTGADGEIRHRQFGEGGYAKTERAIQRLLGRPATGDFVKVDATGPEVPADWDSLGSPESYLGFERAESFASAGEAAPGIRHTYAVPERLRLNEWALAGDWTLARQSVLLDRGEGRLVCRFHARDLHLVVAPPPGRSCRFRVRVDGRPTHGTDTDELGAGTITEPRLYQLVRRDGEITDGTFEATFRDPGVRAYALTFG